VDIALDPNRIPGLIDTPKKQGTRGGYLEHPGDELTLTADNLNFRDTAAGSDEKKDGVVYLTVDGYERAFIYQSTFPRGGVTESELDRIRNPVARLKAAAGADPAKPYPVAVELDNAPPGAVVEIGLDRDADKIFNKKAGEVVTLGSGNRQQQLFVNPAFPGGALELKALMSDWNTKLDVPEIFGPRLLRFRLLTDQAEAAKDNDQDKKLVEFLNAANNTRGFDITETVTFDGTPPEDIHFLESPKKLVRGSSLPVQATATDPESGIKGVVFYVGKPVDGKPPPTAVLVPGKLDDPKTGVWTAKLDAPTEQKGKTEVTAQFTNGAGLVASETVKIELVDGATKEGAAVGKASIAGKVFVGERPQPGVPVQLRDAAGGVLDTTQTNDKGEFIFKDVPAPATYRVAAAKTGDKTKGETVVGVKPDEKKVDVPVNLLR
jgi:hypothetical protein